jgi:hypothetical protein
MTKSPRYAKRKGRAGQNQMSNAHTPLEGPALRRESSCQ